jgi:predicted nucleotidyltransferase component of viral defense system
MAIADGYRKQVALLIRTISFVATEKEFALKGGTAINLFVRDMPRLSVDIDLTYVPVADRATSLKAIDTGMKQIAGMIIKGMRGVNLQAIQPPGEDCTTKLLLRVDGVQIKIEVTPVLRGCVYEPAIKRVSPKVEEEFGFAQMPVVHSADLYAGKIMAVLDRQHPRDLFDVRDLLENEGIDDALRKAFIVYLLSHNRPMAEVLSPQRHDISAEYKRGFESMVERPVSLADLLDAREVLIEEIVGKMPDSHKKFLVSVKRGEPDWSLLDLPNVKELPAVRWKLENLAKLTDEKRAQLLEGLNKAIGID